MPWRLQTATGAIKYLTRSVLGIVFWGLKKGNAAPIGTIGSGFWKHAILPNGGLSTVTAKFQTLNAEKL